MHPIWNKLHRLSLWGMNIGPAGYLGEGSEEWVFRKCLARSPQDRPFLLFDVGANVGDYARSAVSTGDPRLQVFCFEPSEPTMKRLSANLRAHNDVRLFPFGFSSRERQAVLHYHLGGEAEASLVKRDLSHYGIDQNQSTVVRLRRLDEFCAEAGVTHIDFLKLDVEGHELEVLAGAGDLIPSRRIRNLQFEFGAPDIESRTSFKDIYQVLSPHYQIHRIVHRGLVPIDSYSEFLEVYITANYLAVAR